MPDNNDVPIEAKVAILQQKITVWKNTHYSATLDARIAGTLGDAPMEERAKTDMKRALQVRDELERILAEVERGD
jgi:hypothetical protein